MLTCMMYRRFVLSFLFSLITIMGDRLRREIVAIAKRPENAECADCRFQSVHRSLGTHITRVRSVTLDTWDQASVTFMGTVGNKIANQYWEAKLPAHARISPVADAPRRSEFIRQKYELRTWYGQPNTGGTDTTTSTQTITPEMSREQRRQQRLEQRKAGQLTSATPTPSASHAYAQVAAQPIQPTRSTSAPSFHAIAGADERAAAAAGLFAGMNVNSPNGNGHTHTNGNTAQRTTPPVTRTNARTRSASPWVQRPEGGNDEISMTTSTTTSNKPSSQPIDLFALPQTTTTLTHSQSANGDLFAGLTERDNTSTAPPIQLSSSLPETFNLMSLADPPTQHTSFLPTSTSTSTSLDLSNMQIRTEASPLDAFLQASNDTQPVSTYTHVQSASTPYAQPASTTFFPTQEPVQSSGFDFVHTTTTSSTPPAFGFLNETTTSSTTSTSTSSDDPFAHLYGADGTPQAIESQPSSTSTSTSHHRINRYDVGMNRYGSPTTMGRKLSSGTHVCAVDGCGQVRVARGYCSKHINHVDDEPTSTPTTTSSSDDTSAFSFVSGSDDPFQSLPTSDPTPSLDLATPTPATQPLTPPQSTAPITTTTTGTAPSPVHYHHYAPYPYPPYPGYPPPPSAAAAPGQAPPTHPHAAPYPYPPYPYAPYPYPPPGAAAAPPAFPPHSTYPPNQQPPHTAYPPYPSYPGYPPHPQAYPGYPPASTTAPAPSPSPSPPPVAAAAPAPHDPFASFAAAMPGKAAPATAANGNGSAFAFV